MSGTDAIVVNTRERAASGDINDIQSLKDRTLLDLLRSMFSIRAFGLGGTLAESSRNVCLGGFAVAAAGADVTISAGVLLQESALLAPAPGALDSTYRLALLKAAATQTPPAPGAETFYLLEAQMVEVVASTNIVDIFDVLTGVFIPALNDKRTERVPAFQFVAGVGANAPAPSGGDWVPIAIVRRPAGGGAVVASDIMDVRQMWDATAGVNRDVYSSLLTRQRDRFFLTGTVPGTPSDSILLEAEANVLGQRLWFVNSGSFDVTTVNYIDPTTVLVADTWFYVYLVPWQGLGLVDARFGTRTGKGLLVLSSTSPLLQGTPMNGFALTLPTPFGVSTVAINGATCVAALRRNSANTGWVWSESVTPRDFRIQELGLGAGVAVAAGAPLTLNLSGFVPRTAKTARVRVRQTFGDVSDPVNLSNYDGVSSTMSPVGGGPLNQYRRIWHSRRFFDQVFTLPLVLSLTFDWEWNWVAGAFVLADPGIAFYVEGWSE